MTTIVDQIRAGVIDSELAALLWLLRAGAVPIHVTAREPAAAESVAGALVTLGGDAAAVSAGTGDGLEEVLRQPVPLRPATGAVVVARNGRVVAAHLLRPPLRDAGGHIRPQGPAVLATWDETIGGWEHFAWGVIPELADSVGRRAGDFEIEHARRREYLEMLAASDVDDPERMQVALAAYAMAGGAGSRGV